MTQFLQGDTTQLTELREGDTKVFAQEQLDDGWLRQLSLDVLHPWQPEQFGDDLKNDAYDKSEFSFVIRENKTDALLGWLSLNDVQLKNRAADIGIAILASQQGHGYGTDAIKILIKYAFDELNLHKVTLEVNGNNPAAVKVYERVGFKLEGVNKAALYQDGQRFDRLRYGLLQTEWRSLMEVAK